MKEFTAPRDFGTAVCDTLFGCIAKSEVESVRWYRQSDASRIGEYSVQLGAAYFLWPLYLPFIVHGLTYVPPPSPERPADWSYIPDNCPNYDADQPIIIQDATNARQWVEENRWSLDGYCLNDLSRRGVGQFLTNAIAVEIDVLGNIRQTWNNVRCVDVKRNNLRGVMTYLSDPEDPRRGPPDYFDLVTRLLMDDRTWTYETNLVENCGRLGGVTPEAEWPERKLWMRALHPFPPAGFDETFP